MGPVPVTIRAESGRPVYCELTAAKLPEEGPPAPSREALAKATWADVVPAVERAIGTSTVTVGRAGAYGPSHDEIAEALARR